MIALVIISAACVVFFVSRLIYVAKIMNEIEQIYEEEYRRRSRTI